MLRVLHLHHTPGVKTTPDFFTFGLDLLIGANHRERDAGLERSRHLQTSGHEASPHLCLRISTNLQDPGLFLKVLIFVGLCVWKVVDLDAVFIDLIQNLKNKKVPLELLGVAFSSGALREGVSLTRRLSRSLSFSVRVSALAMTGTTFTLLWMAFMNWTSSGLRLFGTKTQSWQLKKPRADPSGLSDMQTASADSQ